MRKGPLREGPSSAILLFNGGYRSRTAMIAASPYKQAATLILTVTSVRTIHMACVPAKGPDVG